MTDECHVHLSGLVNKQNFRVSERTEFPILGADNLGNELGNKSPISALKVNVRVAIGWDDIIGRFF